MPKIFTDEDKDALKTELLDLGFEQLKKSGLGGINIDKLAEKCCIAKGTFYNLFVNKSDFLYRMVLHERARAKSKLTSFLNASQKLTSLNLKNYLIWLSKENPNVFAYLSKPEQKKLVSEWPPEYIENENNDENTMLMLYGLLENPRPDFDWRLACDYMKLLAAALAMKQIFIQNAYEKMLLEIIDRITEILSL